MDEVTFQSDTLAVDPEEINKAGRGAIFDIVFDYLFHRGGMDP